MKKNTKKKPTVAGIHFKRLGDYPNSIITSKLSIPYDWYAEEIKN